VEDYKRRLPHPHLATVRIRCQSNICADNVEKAVATLWQARAMHALLEGTLSDAAHAEGEQRAQALDRQATTARRQEWLRGPLGARAHEGVVRRLMRDAYIAKERQKKYASAALSQPREWRKAVVFSALSVIFPAGIWITATYLVPTSQLIERHFAPMLIALLPYWSIVAAVGARLMSVSRGAELMINALSGSSA